MSRFKDTHSCTVSIKMKVDNMMMKNCSWDIIIGKLAYQRKIVQLTLSQGDSWRNEKYMQALLVLQETPNTCIRLCSA